MVLAPLALLLDEEAEAEGALVLEACEAELGAVALLDDDADALLLLAVVVVAAADPVD